MATLGELRNRIVTEMVRDDLSEPSTGSGQGLSDQLTLHISRAIEYFSDRTFWFNSIIVSADCTAGVSVMDIPASVRRIDRLTIPAAFQEVREVGLEEISGLEPLSGLPYLYSGYNDQIRLYPTPDAVYSLQFTGLKQIDAPTEDGDSATVWTNQAQDLIAARTRMTLYRDQFRDPDGAQMAMAAMREAEDRLLTETARRLETPLRGRSRGGRYNIHSS